MQRLRYRIAIHVKGRAKTKLWRPDATRRLGIAPKCLRLQYHGPLGYLQGDSVTTGSDRPVLDQKNASQLGFALQKQKLHTATAL